MEEKFNIYHDLLINKPKEKVFEAISESQHLINWWPLKCSGKPVMNYEYNFYFSDDYNWYGKVIKSEPNSAFYIKMLKSDSDWNPTTFGFDLKEENGFTQVCFWHKDWPECNRNFKRSSYCWATLLLGLKNYLEKGEVIPFNERE